MPVGVEDQPIGPSRPVAPDVVVSGLPRLAEGLRRHGLAVIDDVDGFETTAIAARRLRAEGSLVGYIVSVRRRSVESWVTRQAKLGMPTVPISGVAEPGTGYSDIGVPEIDLPATVAEILTAVDFDAAGLDISSSSRTMPTTSPSSTSQRRQRRRPLIGMSVQLPLPQRRGLLPLPPRVNGPAT